MGLVLENIDRLPLILFDIGGFPKLHGRSNLMLALQFIGRPHLMICVLRDLLFAGYWLYGASKFAPIVFLGGAPNPPDPPILQ